jgi:hypothetical protein
MNSGDGDEESFGQIGGFKVSSAPKIPWRLNIFLGDSVCDADLYMVFESSEKDESRKVGMESALFDILYFRGIEISTKSMDWMKRKTSNFVKTCHSVRLVGFRSAWCMDP